MVVITATNLETYAYIDDSFQFTIKNNGVAVDITGWTVYFSIKRNRGDTTELIEKTITSFSDPENGVVVVTIDKEDTQDFSGDYFYDFKVDNTAGDRKIYSEGVFKINPGVKRD